MQTKVSIKDISEKAEVSIATVSRVINKNGRYSKETEERVLRVIRENNYQPNLIAKGLREQKMTNVGILVPDIKNEFFTKLVYAIERNLFNSGFETFVCNTDEDEEIEKKHVQMMTMQGVRGLIYISGAIQESGKLTETIPTVYIDRIPKELQQNDIMITSDNVQGGYLAGTELLETGAKRIMFLTAEKHISCYADRYKGFCRALDEKGIPVADRKVVPLKRLHYEDAYACVNSMLERGAFDYDGVFAGSDWLALGCYQALKERGIRIPDQVKIVGYDDISITAFNAVPITTIHQQVDEMGKQTAELLAGLMRGDHPQQTLVTVPVYLVPRMSTRGGE